MTHLEALATAVAYGALGAAHIEYMRYFEGWAHGLDDLRFPFNMIFRGFGAERTELTALTTLFFPMLLITWRGRSEGTAKCFPAAVYIAASAQICAYYHRLWAVCQNHECLVLNGRAWASQLAHVSPTIIGKQLALFF
jgi:hypothetical protein